MRAGDRERELDLARLALYLREARRAARRLGVQVPGLRGGTAGILFGAALVEGVLRVAGGAADVPALNYTERELPERVPLQELLESIAEEFRD